MARPGTPSRVRKRDTGVAADTRQRLVDAAIEALREDGFGGASARNIATRADCNQGLVFYHFGSVANLLLAALDEVSERRLSQYRAKVDGVQTPKQLVSVATDIFGEDLDKGYVTVLAEMIAGASSTPGLGSEVAKRIRPWRKFASEALSGALVGSGLDALPTDTLAHGVVALYLGLELLAHLDGDRRPATALFDQVASLTDVLGALFREPSAT